MKKNIKGTLKPHIITDIQQDDLLKTNMRCHSPFSPNIYLFIHYFAFPQCVFCPVPPTPTSTTPPYCSRWQSFLPVKEFFLPTVSECLVQY